MALWASGDSTSMHQQLRRPGSKGQVLSKLSPATGQSHIAHMRAHTNVHIHICMSFFYIHFLYRLIFSHQHIFILISRGGKQDGGLWCCLCGCWARLFVLICVADCEYTLCMCIYSYRNTCLVLLLVGPGGVELQKLHFYEGPDSALPTTGWNTDSDLRRRCIKEEWSFGSLTHKQVWKTAPRTGNLNIPTTT